jgi:cyanophycinase
MAQESEKTMVGPEKGHLVIVGGGRLSDDILLKFIELAGGMDAKIILIPTAGGGEEYTDEAGGYFRSKGATNVVVLHTIDPKEADSDEFIKPIENAGGVWFTGGRQWRLVDSYKNTKSELAFRNVLERGGVIGGSSAGATIQGSYLARGDTENNQIMMGDHEEGFSYLKNVAIDQHVLARNRQFDLFTILKEKPDLLGIGIDENTAIVVKGDEFEVIGSSYVLMYDNTFWSREGWNSKNLPEEKDQFYFLRKGDKYNLKDRVILDK